eukprot:1157485-Pelagomonas_calceolata.AAC.5
MDHDDMRPGSDRLRKSNVDGRDNQLCIAYRLVGKYAQAVVHGEDKKIQLGFQYLGTRAEKILCEARHMVTILLGQTIKTTPSTENNSKQRHTRSK